MQLDSPPRSSHSQPRTLGTHPQYARAVTLDSSVGGPFWQNAFGRRHGFSCSQCHQLDRPASQVCLPKKSVRFGFLQLSKLE